jgi:hypothetical protein
MNITIANLNFLIKCMDAPLLIEPRPATYEPFITDTNIYVKGSPAITIALKIKDLPPAGRLTEIFRCGDSWAMCKKGDEYYLVLNPSLPGGPECIARFDHGLEKVTIYCGGINIVEVEGKKMVRNPFSYPLDQLLLMYALSQREGVMLHASGVGVNGRGYIFPGKSGAGKSTISRIFISGNHDVLSDDRVVVRKTRDAFRVFGTPWAGDAGIAQNKDLPLHGIFFILHGNENKIEKITTKEAFERLMPVTSIPWYDEKVMPDLLSFCEDLVLHVPAYVLHFTPDSRAADLIEGFVSDKEIHGAVT